MTDKTNKYMILCVFCLLSVFMLSLPSLIGTYRGSLLDYAIICLVIVYIVYTTILIVIGLHWYRTSPRIVARKTRKAEILKQKRDERIAETIAVQKAKEEQERKEYEYRERIEREKRETKERIEREKQAAEEAKMREMFKKFMAEEQGKTVTDVDKMFDEWRTKKEKI